MNRGVGILTTRINATPSDFCLKGFNSLQFFRQSGFSGDLTGKTDFVAIRKRESKPFR
jgi:hypothetical protein